MGKTRETEDSGIKLCQGGKICTVYWQGDSYLADAQWGVCESSWYVYLLSIALPSKVGVMIREWQIGQDYSLRIFSENHSKDCRFYFYMQSSLKAESKMIRYLSQKNSSESFMQNNWEGY